MCKILVVTGETDRETAEKILQISNERLRKSERHGYGFLVTDGIQRAFGRYLNPESFSAFQANLPAWLTGPCLESGQMPEKPNVILTHGRTSTNKVCVENVHPFQRNGDYLIHNGILDWIGKGEAPVALNGCDTESYLAWLQSNDEQYSELNWAGYGAIFWLSKAGLKLIKCKDARLFACKREGSGWVFGTNADDVSALVHETGLLVRNRPLPVPECVLTFDRQGEVSTHENFIGFADRKFDQLAVESIGKFWSDGPPKHLAKKPRKSSKLF